MNLGRLYAATAVLSVVLAACGGNGAGAPWVLRFAYDNWPGYYPALIASEKGFFRERGVEVACSKRDNTDAMLADFVAGRYEAVGISLGDIASLQLVGADVRIVLVTDISEGGDAVLARAPIESLEDLRGQRLGVNLGSFAELFVRTALKAHGLTAADVRLIDTDAADIPAKLNSGDLDAGHTWEPFVTAAQGGGARVLFTSSATPGLIQDVIAVRGEVVREHPDAIAGFVAAWFKAVDYWKANPAVGNAIAGEALGVDPGTISTKGMRLTTHADNLELFKPGDTTASIYHTLQMYVDFFVGTGGLIRRPDVDEVLEPRFLK